MLRYVPNFDKYLCCIGVSFKKMFDFRIAADNRNNKNYSSCQFPIFKNNGISSIGTILKTDENNTRN